MHLDLLSTDSFSSVSFSSLTALTALVASVHKSEVWLLNFLRLWGYIIYGGYNQLDMTWGCRDGIPIMVIKQRDTWWWTLELEISREFWLITSKKTIERMDMLKTFQGERWINRGLASNWRYSRMLSLGFVPCCRPLVTDCPQGVWSHPVPGQKKSCWMCYQVPEIDFPWFS